MHLLDELRELRAHRRGRALLPRQAEDLEVAARPEDAGRGGRHVVSRGAEGAMAIPVRRLALEQSRANGQDSYLARFELLRLYRGFIS